MKQYLPALLATLVIVSCIGCTLFRGKRSAEKIEVKGTILQISDYCGGAAPSEEQQNPRPLPRANAKLYVRASSSNDGSRIIDSILSGSDGKFTVSLTPGTYCLIEKPKTEKYAVPVDTKYVTFDTACHRKLYQQCDFVLEVKQGMKQPEIVLRHYCMWRRPCEAYNGPLPPSAPPVNRGGHQPGHQE